jgi:hypothetical protein
LLAGADDDLAAALKLSPEFTAFERLGAKETALAGQLSVIKARLATAEAQKNEVTVTADAASLPGALAKAGKVITVLRRQSGEIEAAIAAVAEERSKAAPALGRKILAAAQEAANERATTATDRRDAALANAAAKVAADVAEAALWAAAWSFAQQPLICARLANKLGCAGLVTSTGALSSHLQTAPTRPAQPPPEQADKAAAKFLSGTSRPPAAPVDPNAVPLPGSVVYCGARDAALE